MKSLKFTKMVASGNDFVVINKFDTSILPDSKKELAIFARYACDRKFGIGADGVLVIEKSKLADFKMRIFNADGSEAEMCGNGSRCAALYYAERVLRSKKDFLKLKIQALAGLLSSEVKSDIIKVKLTDPHSLKLDIPLDIDGKEFNVHFINTGVPHVVFFCDRLEELDIIPIARQIRYHKKFSPRGANVNFVTVIDSKNIRIRTYERGVEDETLACGTGSTASAIISAVLFKKTGENIVKVLPRSNEPLNIYFNNHDNKLISDVWLEGGARFVFDGSLTE